MTKQTLTFFEDGRGLFQVRFLFALGLFLPRLSVPVSDTVLGGGRPLFGGPGAGLPMAAGAPQRSTPRGARWAGGQPPRGQPLVLFTGGFLP